MSFFFFSKKVKLELIWIPNGPNHPPSPSFFFFQSSTTVGALKWKKKEEKQERKKGRRRRKRKDWAADRSTCGRAGGAGSYWVSRADKD
jgi:hypothetical protein